MPTGCFGNNMAVRAQAVKEIGGFRTLGFSVTEDAMLLDAVCRAGGWKVRTCTTVRAAAFTRAQAGWGAFIDQHTRWNAGALFSPDLFTRVSFSFVVLFYLVGSLVVLPLGILDWRVAVLSLNSFLSIGLLAALAGLYEGKNRARYFLRFLPFLFFFGFFYSFITVRALVRRPFDWKGSTLRPSSARPGITVPRDICRSRYPVTFVRSLPQPRQEPHKGFGSEQGDGGVLPYQLF